MAAADFEDPLQTYRGSMVKLAQLVLSLLALALPSPAPSNIFDDFMLQPSGNLRLLHYPPKLEPNPDQLGCKSAQVYSNKGTDAYRWSPY